MLFPPWHGPISSGLCRLSALTSSSFLLWFLTYHKRCISLPKSSSRHPDDLFMQQILYVLCMHKAVIANINAQSNETCPCPHEAIGEMVFMFNYGKCLNRKEHREPWRLKGGRCGDHCSLLPHVRRALSHPCNRFLVSQIAPLKKWPFWLSGSDASLLPILFVLTALYL